MKSENCAPRDCASAPSASLRELGNAGRWMKMPSAVAMASSASQDHAMA